MVFRIESRAPVEIDGKIVQKHLICMHQCTYENFIFVFYSHSLPVSYSLSNSIAESQWVTKYVNEKKTIHTQINRLFCGVNINMNSHGDVCACECVLWSDTLNNKKIAHLVWIQTYWSYGIPLYSHTKTPIFFIHSFIRSFVRSFIDALTQSLIYSYSATALLSQPLAH